MAFTFLSLRRWASGKDNKSTAKQQLPERGSINTHKKLEAAKTDALKQAKKPITPAVNTRKSNPSSSVQKQSGTNHHSEITTHSLSRPNPVADNTPSYCGVSQQPTTTATTAIRSTPKLVYHHPRQSPTPSKSKTCTTSHPNYTHYTSPTALSPLSQLKTFLLLPQTTPDQTLLLNLLTKHHKVRLDLPAKNPWLAAQLNNMTWHGIHKHTFSSSLTKSQRWVLENFVKSQRVLFDVRKEGYNLFAIAERLGEIEVKRRRLNRAGGGQWGEIRIVGGREVSLVPGRYRPCKERYFPPPVLNTARRLVCV